MSKHRLNQAPHGSGNRKQRRAKAKAERRAAKTMGSAATGAALALGLGLHASEAHANTFTVTTTNDSGAGSLRDAVSQANANAGPDVVDLTGVSGTITVTSEILVTDEATLMGPGSGSLTVSGGTTTRVFDVAPSTFVPVTISGLKITLGINATGGGIYSNNVDLTLDDVFVTMNAGSNRGAGVYMNVGSLTITDSEISNNNVGLGAGGGVFVQTIAAGRTLAIADSKISGNNAQIGGGVMASFIYGAVTIDRTTISGNTAIQGAGLKTQIIQDPGTVDVRATTISGNTAASSGGGIVIDENDGEFRLQNSTISGNQAPRAAGFEAGFGYDEYYDTRNYDYIRVPTGDGSVTISSSTFTANTALQSGGAAGIWARDGRVDLVNTIVGGNTGADVTQYYGSFTFNHCVIQSPSGIVVPPSGNITGVDPQLGALQSNGGPTFTHLPAQGSPVIDAGDPAFTPPPAQDQRGEARVTNSVIDVGAVEVAALSPTITAIGNQTIDEDQSTSAIAFVIDDPDDGIGPLTIEASSSDTALVPNANILLGGVGANRTVTVTPAGNASGMTTITISVSDGTHTTTRDFLVTVTAVNDLPTISMVADQLITEDGATSAIGFSVADIETAAGSLTVSGTSSAQGIVADAGIVIGGSGTNRTVTVTPLANASGTATITLTVSDGTDTNQDTFDLTIDAVDDPPAIAALSPQSTNEDAATGPISVSVSDPDSNLSLVTIGATSSNQNVVADSGISLGGSGASRTIDLTPVANASGMTTITVTVSDGNSMDSKTFVLTVNSVNDLPTISSVSNQTLDEDTATSALAFTVGDVETASGSLTVTGTSSNQAVVANSGIVIGGSGASRTVTVTPVANASGSATITLTVNDGTTDATQTFTVTVDAVNDAPTVSTVGDQMTTEDASIGPLSVTVGDDGLASALTLSASSSNTSLVANSGIALGGSGTSRTVSITPVANANGSAVITLTVSDGTLTDTSEFDVQFTPVNDPPTLTAIADQPIDEDDTAGPVAFTIGDPDNDPSTLQLSADSANEALVADDNIVFGGSGASRTVTVTPDANESGSTTIEISVSDGTNTTSGTFDVIVGASNDLPIISPIADQQIDVDGMTDSLAFTIGDVETPASSLTVTASSSNQTVIPDSNIMLAGSGVNRTITLTAAPNESGTAHITISVGDGTATTQQEFDVEVNTPATITEIGDQSIQEDTATAALEFTIGDVETDLASLVVTAESSNTELVDAGGIELGGTGAVRTVTITPLGNRSGTTNITISVDDGIHTVTQTFVVTVLAVGDAPTISEIADVTIDEDGATGPIAFTVGDIDSDAANLVVTATSSDPNLVPGDGIVLGGSGPDRTLTLTPTENKHGTAQIMLVVSDGASTATRSFTLTVESVNDVPMIAEISDQFIHEGESTGNIDVFIADADGAEDLTLTATSSSQTLLPDDAITFGGSGTDRTIKLAPASDQFGTADVTVTVSDGTDSATTTFTLKVSEASKPSETPDAGEMPSGMSPDAGGVDEPEEDASIPTDEADTGKPPKLRIKKGGCSVSGVQTSEPAPRSLLATFLGVFAFGVRRRRRRKPD
jgi:MYXO-CTERM domain-containing protein